MDRRAFVKTCGLGAGWMLGQSSLALASDTRLQGTAPVRLLDAAGAPLRAGALIKGEALVFHYPYATTPCFLLNLGRPLPGYTDLRTEHGQRYDWPGGVGPQASIVAFSAICAHKMAHPTATVSYISYRPPRSALEPADGVISCCAENSVYDPATGATVLSGPAPQPLATIVLEHHLETDGLVATGTLGGEMFQRFFNEFARRLSLEHPSRDLQALVTDSVRCVPLRDYSRNIMSC